MTASAKERLQSNTVAAGLIFAAGHGAKYLLQVLFARWMTPDAYGAYAYVLNWVIMITVVATLGFNLAALRFVPEHLAVGDGSNAGRFVRFARVVVMGVGLLLAAVLAGAAYLGTNKGGILAAGLMFGAWMLPLHAVMELHSMSLNGARRVLLAFVPPFLLWPGLTIVIALVMRSGALTLEVALGATAAALGGVVLVQGAMLRRVLGAPTGSGTRENHKQWLLVALPLMTTGGFMMLVMRADVVLMGMLQSATATGHYNAAARTAAVAQLALAAIGIVVAPILAGLHARGDNLELRRMCRTAAQWMFLGALGVAAVLWAAAEWILGLFGPGFAAATAPLYILVGAQVIHASTGPVGHLLNLTGHERRTLLPYGVAAATNVGLGLVLIPIHGMTGAALAMAVSLTLWNVWMAVLARKHLGFWTLPFLPLGSADKAAT